MAISTYEIRWLNGQEPEKVRASEQYLKDGWFVFEDGDGLVVRVRADDVERVTRT